MFHSIDEFAREWQSCAGMTQGCLDALTDASLGQPVADGQRTLGRIAWHLAQTIPEMLERTGLEPAGPAHDAPVPETAREIADAYRTAAGAALEQVRRRWADDTLEVEDEMYGQKWKRGQTLTSLVHHEIHHRGQLTVLMRQAGIRPPGTYGPAKEDWAKMNMQPPAI